MMKLSIIRIDIDFNLVKYVGVNSSLSSKSDKLSMSKFFSSFSIKTFDSSISNCNIFWKLYKIISVSCLSNIFVLSQIFDL